jgi:hypothetical protein
VPPQRRHAEPHDLRTRSWGFSRFRRGVASWIRSRALARLELAGTAAAGGVWYKTVANTCTHIRAKLGVARAADLVRMVPELGLM